MSNPTSPDNQPTASFQPGSGESTIQRNAQDSANDLCEQPGGQVGPYRLLELIGEGGFGFVWLAERLEPMVQRVALKIMKPGMDSKAVVARFEQERQALAVMDHPNVAKVLDGGVTVTGRPYFVMEYVPGASIIRFCDRHRLPIRKRLELFLPVCEAVQHAHMKGIIHRDIKPSNILIADGGESHAAVPKVIDFGVAKAMSHTLIDKTIFTERGQLIGTPEYMSPEQADMGATDIDTRADVYSLGVVLYELLSGTLPFDPKTLRSAGYAEIQRIIREVDPPKPSTKLITADAQTGAAIAKARQDQRERLAGELRRELEWIPMKALRKDRSRRYASAESLAADVRRYLEGRPLEAAPESRAYLVKKFVRRYRVQVSAFGAVVLALSVGFGTALWQAREAARQRDAAELARELQAQQRARADERTSAAEKAEKAEKERADQLRRVSDFQSSMLAQIDPTRAGAALMADVRERFAKALEKAGVPDAPRRIRLEVFSRELDEVNATDTAMEMLDRAILKPAVGAVEAQFKDQPAVDASLRHALAELYRSLGKHADALALETRAVETRRRVLGDEHPDTLVSIDTMGAIYDDAGDQAKAEAAFREVVEKRRRVLGVENSATLQSIGNLANALRAQGKFNEAEPLLREALEGRRRVLGDAHRQTLISLNTYGFLFIEQGNLKEGEPYWRKAYEIGKREFGTDDPDVLVWTHNLAGLLVSMGRYADALPYFREVVETARRIHGLEHPTTLTCMTGYANALAAVSQFSEAQAIAREALDARRRTLGNDHPETLFGMLMLGNLLRQGGNLAEAEPYHRDALDGRLRTLSRKHPSTLNAMNALARLCTDQERFDEAEKLYRDVLNTSTDVWKEENANRLQTMNGLSVVLLRTGKHVEAEPLIRQCLETRHRVLGPDHPDTLDSRISLARLLELQGKLDEAETLYRDVRARYLQAGGEDNPSALNATLTLCEALRLRGKLPEIEPLLRDTQSRMTRVFGKNDARTSLAHLRLGQLLLDLRRYKEAEAELMEAERTLTNTQGLSPIRLAKCRRTLVDLYDAWQSAEPGQGHDTEAAKWRAMLHSTDAEPGMGPSKDQK